MIPVDFVSIEPFMTMPNNLIFFGYFWSGLRTNVVRDFRREGLTGPEIAVIMQRHPRSLLIERSLFVAGR